MLPTTVDGVIEQLETIIDESIASQSRLGYFAALYKRMTMAVRDGIRDGKFQDVTRRRWSASLLSFGLLFLLCAVAATARHRGG